MKYDSKPREIKRFNSLHENDVLADKAFQRLAERDKIFCSKSVKDTTCTIQYDLFQIHLKSFRSPLMTIGNEAGTNSDMDIGMNNSSKVLAANTNLEPLILSSNTRKNNLTTTSTVTTPRMKPKIMFNSAASTLTSREDGGPCSDRRYI